MASNSPDIFINLDTTGIVKLLLRPPADETGIYMSFLSSVCVRAEFLSELVGQYCGSKPTLAIDSMVRSDPRSGAAGRELFLSKGFCSVGSSIARTPLVGRRVDYHS